MVNIGADCYLVSSFLGTQSITKTTFRYRVQLFFEIGLYFVYYLEIGEGIWNVPLLERRNVPSLSNYVPFKYSRANSTC